MDVLTEVLHRVRLNGTVLYHYELGCPWGLALPRLGDVVFHYLSRGSAILTTEDGGSFDMTAGDLALVAHDRPHFLWSDCGVKPVSLRDIQRRPAHLGVVRCGGDQEPISTMICGYFSLSAASRSSVLELLPPVLRLRPEHEWLEAVLHRLVEESASERPGRCAVLSRITELLFVEVLRSWIKSLRAGEGGWLGAISDPHIGKALQMIHEDPQRAWSLQELARQSGLGRSAFAARFTRLVGQPMHRYLVGRRMEEAAVMLVSSDETISRIAARAGYATATAFAKAFQRHYDLSPGRYRASRQARGSGPVDTGIRTIEALN